VLSLNTEQMATMRACFSTIAALASVACVHGYTTGQARPTGHALHEDRNVSIQISELENVASLRKTAINSTSAMSSGEDDDGDVEPLFFHRHHRHSPHSHTPHSHTPNPKPPPSPPPPFTPTAQVRCEGVPEDEKCGHNGLPVDGCSCVKTFNGYSGTVCVSESVTDVPAHKFYTISTGDGCETVSVDMPSVTSVGTQAFWRNTDLKYVNAPLLEQVSGYAFASCGQLREVQVPALTFIDYNAFSSSFSSGNPGRLVLPSVTEIESAAFSYTTKLKEVEMPVVTKIRQYAFYEAFALDTALMPNVERIEKEAFYATDLTNVYMPALTTLQTGAFQQINNHMEATVPATLSYNDDAFYDCTWPELGGGTNCAFTRDIHTI